MAFSVLLCPIAERSSAHWPFTNAPLENGPRRARLLEHTELSWDHRVEQLLDHRVNYGFFVYWGRAVRAARPRNSHTAVGRYGICFNRILTQRDDNFG
jgi:hypothetical protein